MSGNGEAFDLMDAANRTSRLKAERDNNHKLYVAALNERDEWKERYHKVEIENQRLRDALSNALWTHE